MSLKSPGIGKIAVLLVFGNPHLGKAQYRNLDLCIDLVDSMNTILLTSHTPLLQVIIL